MLKCSCKPVSTANNYAQTINLIENIEFKNKETKSELRELESLLVKTPKPTIDPSPKITSYPYKSEISSNYKHDPHYFQTVHISLLSLLKLSNHAKSGGSIEIMGLLRGYTAPHAFIITDCYPLPVEGTESRVNPGNDSYQFMLEYLNNDPGDLVVGWYHSHPGFGCWLSKIDIETQKLQQGWEDPYVAIVVDPKSDLLDIGAFRTYYKESQMPGEYYQLNVEVWVDEKDMHLLKEMVQCENKQDFDLAGIENILKLSNEKEKWEKVKVTELLDDLALKGLKQYLERRN
ncbi:COP9 signalosome catalytic subunit [Martiniozyma asiatica (nom. inval.)]|nr:COP9 signalosome catalytic subunit [Martiniozyma asiatica]